MGKNLFRKDIWGKSLSKAKKDFNPKGEIMRFIIATLLIIFVLLLIFVSGFYFFSGSIPTILWQILGGEFILLVASNLSIYVVAFFDMWNVAEEEYKKKEKIIKKLKENFIYPKLNFSVLSLGESFIGTKEYASIVVENTEDFEIDDFYATITGFAIQKNYAFGWTEFIKYVNPGGNRVSVDGRADNEIISVGNKGGKVRFNIVCQGDQKIIVLNQNKPFSIIVGDEFKITITFNGKCQGKFIDPINKIYQLSCAYSNQEKSTGITIFEFKEYRGKSELLTE